MTQPSVGIIDADALSWKKKVPFAHSTSYRQPNRPGNSHVIGPRYGESCIITTEHFHEGIGYEKTFLKLCATQCGTSVTVTEVDSFGITETHADVYIESVTPVKSTACVGPGDTSWITILEWVVYLPEDW